MENKDLNLEEVSLKLIIHSGNARGEVFEALRAARASFFEEAYNHLKKADEELQKAHKVHTKLIQSGENVVKSKADLLFVHAHGHMMTVMSEKSLVEEMIELYKRLGKEKNITTA